MIQCVKCYSLQPTGDCQYIGQTGGTLRERFGEHRHNIMNKFTDKSGVAEHFNRRDYTLSDITIISLEAIGQKPESLRRAREQQLITAGKTLTLRSIKARASLIVAQARSQMCYWLLLPD